MPSISAVPSTSAVPSISAVQSISEDLLLRFSPHLSSVLLTSEIVASRDDFCGSSTRAPGARGPSDREEGESACRGRRGGGSASPTNFAGAARVEDSGRSPVCARVALPARVALQAVSAAILLGLLPSGTVQADGLEGEDETSPVLGPLLPEPLAGKKEKDPFEDIDEDVNYRYNFEERKLSFGLDLGGGMANGIVVRAFPFGGTVTPYFRGGFGDGNALEFDLGVGINPLSAVDSYWLFFRTPVLSGSAAGGYLATISPNLAFRYETDLSASIAKRSRVVMFGGLGLGPTITYGSALLVDNGNLGDTTLTNLEIFFDIVPLAGMKFRLGEFAYMQLGARLHFMVPIVANVNGAGWEFGRPQTIPEFWIDGSRYLDVFLGFGYDFG